MVSPLYSLPRQIVVAAELQPIPDDFSKFPSYSFSAEKEALSTVETSRNKSHQEQEKLHLLRRKYEDERINKQKLAARKIAPGFLDTDTRILKPEQTYMSQDFDEHETVQYPTPVNVSPGKHFDYLKFEQGLAPADPWDTPENDMVALTSILGSPRMPSYEPKRTPTPPSYPPTNYHVQPQQPQPMPFKNEGVYWNFQQNTSTNGYPQQHTSNVPALPPKLFNTPSLNSSPPRPPLPSDYQKIPEPTIPTPPPVPPLPTSPMDGLVVELGNMGFTRAQAIDALEKNDHDLMRATNFLLDQVG
ncbi:hypothetical protein K501DRAFT_319235 [Backusella circina FSU 941]|nr:hypothetical protein K501DRAFT_319235 [Backusella circina FSU 941]